ncbi:secreted amidase [Coccidioides posadasii str. Silveira]|uniref:Secreted amidase n=1 Tax=Coccidioides posadasii (strain RMSCC 757 / Silveira) TaxID=443226 RepID=E9DA56_COCPS|nr:secreted amidase [Coccidioides posadasii str. Silveira]
MSQGPSRTHIPIPLPFSKQNSDEASLFPMQLCHGSKLEQATVDKVIYQTDGYVKYGFPFQALDKDRVNGRTRGPLHGIPFFLKENMTTKYRIETTAGSWALQGSVVPRDAYVVHKSRKAGALLLAKAGMSEWAEIRKMDYSQGYAAFGGQGRSAIISLYTLVEAAQALRLRYLLIRRLSHWTLRPTEVAIMLSLSNPRKEILLLAPSPLRGRRPERDWEWGTKCGYANESKYMIMKVDFYNDLRAYLSEPENTNTRSLEDIVEYNYNDDGTKSRHPDSHPAWPSWTRQPSCVATKGI